MSKEKTASRGIGLGGMIFIVFLILKLVEIGQVATWSWWWVTSPLWIPLAFVTCVLGLIGIIAVITAFLTK